MQEQLHLHTASEEQLNRILNAIEIKNLSSRIGETDFRPEGGEGFPHPPPRIKIGVQSGGQINRKCAIVCAIAID